MKKVLQFVITDGKKVRTLDIDMELRNHETCEEFSVTMLAYRSKHRDYRYLVGGGQCLELIANTIWGAVDNRFPVIYKMWKKHHLNTMHAGTEAQEACLETARKNGELKSGDYIADCNYLETKGLLIDGDYKYGTSWLARPIPEDDLSIIREIMLGGEMWETVNIKIPTKLMRLIDVVIKTYRKRV